MSPRTTTESTGQSEAGGFSRRDFLRGTGMLVVGFSLDGATRLWAQSSAETARASTDPRIGQVDSWLIVSRDESVTLLVGKVELGTGINTALLQIAAEELDVPFEHMRILQGLTGTTPDQYVSSASAGVSVGGPPLRQAAAEARQVLLRLASARFGVPVEQLVVSDGVVRARDDASKRASYGELIGDQRFDVTMEEQLVNFGGPTVRGSAELKDPQAYTIVGTSVPRIDIPAKVTGQYPFLHNVRLPGMLHGRTLKPPTHGARLVRVDESSVRDIPGFVDVVVEGDFVGVVCEREEQAIRAAEQLRVEWTDSADLPRMEDLYETLRQCPVKTAHVASTAGDVDAALAGATQAVTATYQSPYQMHASIGPSCAVADVRDGEAEVWSGSQGVYGIRNCVAEILAIPAENVVVHWTHASGCYGNNGADDVTTDAVVLSRAVGRPVRLQWTREEENGWAGYCPARVSDLRGGLDAQGNIVAWDSKMWTFAAWNRPAYLDRPGGIPGNTMTAQLLGWPLGEDLGLGATNVGSVPSYAEKIPNRHVLLNYLGTSTHRHGSLRIRVASVRGVGGVPAAFPVESFMDELAVAATTDAVEFRLRHLSDPRAIAVLRAAARRAGWQSRPSPNPDRGSSAVVRGRGVALTGRAAVVIEAEVNRDTGAVRFPRVVHAFDCGLIVNPDGLRNQIEGCIIQGISRAMLEEVKFNRSTVTSLDQRSYPILELPQAPDTVEIVLIDRPNEPASGAGEPPQNPIAAGVANAIFDATGIRLRTQPFTPERIKAAVAAQA